MRQHVWTFICNYRKLFQKLALVPSPDGNKCYETYCWAHFVELVCPKVSICHFINTSYLPLVMCDKNLQTKQLFACNVDCLKYKHLSGVFVTWLECGNALLVCAV